MMRKTADFRLVFAAGALAALACGGVSEQDFFDKPTPKRVQTGGAGGMSSVGGSAGSGAATGGSAATTGGSGGTTTAGATSTGGTVSAGGSGSTAAGGTSSGDAGTSGDTGAGNASSSGGTSGTGGSVGTGGIGGSSAGTGGSAAGSGGDGGAPIGGAGSGAGAGQGGMTAMGGAGASAGGRAGRGGGPGMTCAERLDALADKLDAAQECSMAQDAGCDDFVKDECGCEVPVNRASSAETKDYLNAVKEIGDCAECTRSSCENYTRAYCRSTSGGGIMGRCQGVGLTTL